MNARKLGERLIARGAGTLRPFFLPVGLLALVSSCSFILDFDELQSGGAGAGGGGTGGGTGGSSDASAGGTAGRVDASADCPNGCDDNDPCTENLCTPEGCRFIAQAGIVPDGFSQVLAAPSFYRVTMTARGDRVYLSAYENTATGPEVVLHYFGRTGTDLSAAVPLKPLLEIPNAVPISAAGLDAPDAGTSLVAYVALGMTPGEAGLVIRLVFGLDLTLVSATATSATVNDYLGGPQTYPVVWEPPGGEVTGAWPAPDGGVMFHNPTTPAITTTTGQIGAGEGVVRALAPLAQGSNPGALYLTDTGVHMQSVTQAAPFTIQELCAPLAGAISSAASAFTGLLNGLWIGSWSQQLTQSAVTETRPIICYSGASGSGCAASQTCDATRGNDVMPNARNPALSFLTLQGDPAGRVYEVMATSFVDPGTSEGGVSLSAFRADFDLTSADAGVAVVPVTVEPVELVRMPLGPNGVGPNWPAMALLPPDKLAVAWIQPSQSGDELHIERHRICYPPP